MRYVAVLQRFDDAHCDVAHGNNEAEVIAAAQAVYTALVPTILARGIDAVKRDRADIVDRGEQDELREHDALLKGGNEISMQLQSREWGVAVYDRKSNDPNELWSTTPTLVFWIGATREPATVR